MGALAAQVAIGAGTGLLGQILARKTNLLGTQRPGEEKTAISGAQGVAQQLQGLAPSFATQSQGIYGAAIPAYQNAINYYSTLLGRGGRSAMQAAVAPAAENIAGTYAGAIRGTERMAPGGVRDQAVAELHRERAGSIARLLQGVQPGAAQALMGGGTAGLGAAAQVGQAGAATLGQAGNIYSNLLQGGFQNRAYSGGLGQAFGSGLGGLIFQLLAARNRGTPTSPGQPTYGTPYKPGRRG